MEEWAVEEVVEAAKVSPVVDSLRVANQDLPLGSDEDSGIYFNVK